MESLFNRPLSIDAIFKTNGITDEIQKHIFRTYAALTATVLCAAFGVIFSLRTGFAFDGFLPLIAMIGAMFYLASTTGEPTMTRLAVLLGFGFFKGCAIGPLIAISLRMDPSIALTAFVGTAAVFSCFSLAALISKRRSFLYLGGMLSSAVSILFWMSILNRFWPSAFLLDVNLYAGLLVFCGWVIFDTQLMIEKAELGSKDYVYQALELFIDFIAIFVRILIILMKNNEKKRQQEQRNKNSSRR